MNAMYFYNKLLKYREESKRTGRYCSPYDFQNVSIHKIGDEKNWFLLYEDGTVLKYEGYVHEEEKLTIQDLQGDDFELFNFTQIFKSGYLVLDTKSEYEVKKIITKLYYYIDSLESKDGQLPHICGGVSFYNKVTDYFQYHDIDGMYLEFTTVRNLCKENVIRKYYGLCCIPFDKNIENKYAIHVRFVNCMDIFCLRERRDICDKALARLFEYMNVIGVEFHWVDSCIRKPLYCQEVWHDHYTRINCTTLIYRKERLVQAEFPMMPY